MFNYFEQNRNFNFFIYKIYHKIFSEKFNKKILYDFDNSKSRLDLINFVLNSKNCQNYLEIGCDQNQVFDNIQLENKVGVDPSSGGNFRGTSDEFFNQNKKKPTPTVRIHSSCLTVDLMGSQKCDCGYQLQSAIEFMSKNKNMNILIYLNQEGRGVETVN